VALLLSIRLSVGFNNHVEYSRYAELRARGSALVGAPASGDQHDINDARVVVTPKADAPVPHSQPPLTRETLEWADVACGKGSNRVQKALAFRTRQPLQRLHHRRADSDPPRPRVQS